jgi:hypothetical protein
LSHGKRKTEIGCSEKYQEGRESGEEKENDIQASEKDAHGAGQKRCKSGEAEAGEFTLNRSSLPITGLPARGAP